jgi:uncharacterized membrane protein YphA (DoxX/SURF4 family)
MVEENTMDVVLWLVQGVLAVVFVGSGIMKLTKTRAEIAQQKGMGYAADFTDTQIKSIGLADLLGALGLIAPWALGIVRVLTPLAALGLAIMMIGAVATHVRRKEPFTIPAVLGALALFVAVGRAGQLG